VLAWHYDSGTIAGVDISGLTAVAVAEIPANMMTPGSWRVALFLDERGSDAQREALMAGLTGHYGGPMADIARLFGEVVAVVAAPIQHDVEDGRGVLEIPRVLRCEMQPYTNMRGNATTLQDGTFTTVPEAPAYIAKQSRYWVKLPQFGMTWEYRESNAIQTEYRVEYDG